jgi:hypothetical protein
LLPAPTLLAPAGPSRPRGSICPTPADARAAATTDARGAGSLPSTIRGACPSPSPAPLDAPLRRGDDDSDNLRPGPGRWLGDQAVAGQGAKDGRGLRGRGMAASVEVSGRVGWTGRAGTAGSQGGTLGGMQAEPVSVEAGLQVTPLANAHARAQTRARALDKAEVPLRFAVWGGYLSNSNQMP